MFLIAADKEARVSDFVVITDGLASWQPPFRRHFQDWEVDEVYYLLFLLDGVSSIHGGRIL